jgi:hypothetical protein
MSIVTLFLHSHSHQNLWKWLEVSPMTMVLSFILPIKHKLMVWNMLLVTINSDKTCLSLVFF